MQAIHLLGAETPATRELQVESNEITNHCQSRLFQVLSHSASAIPSKITVQLTFNQHTRSFTILTHGLTDAWDTLVIESSILAPAISTASRKPRFAILLVAASVAVC